MISYASCRWNGNSVQHKISSVQLSVYLPDFGIQMIDNGGLGRYQCWTRDFIAESIIKFNYSCLASVLIDTIKICW